MATSRLFQARSRTRLPQNWLPVGVGLLSYSTALARGQALLADQDVYLHIAVGRWIIEHGAVPHTDIFSHSLPEAPWVPHEWLSDVLLALLFDHFGWLGLFVLIGVAFALTMALVSHFLLKFLAPAYALIGTLTAWGMCFPNLVARPHVLILPLVVTWVTTLVIARSRDKAPPPYAALLILLWANLHGSFMMALAFTALFAGEALFEANDRKAARSVIVGWGVFGLLSSAAAFLTPNGVAGFLLPLDMVRMNFALSLITEWQSPNFQHPHPIEMWLLLLLLGSLMLGIKLPITRILMVLILVHLALTHQRHGMLLGLITPLLVAPALASQLPRKPDDFIRAILRGPLAGPTVPALASVIIIAAGIIGALGVTAWRREVTDGVDRFTPAAALAAAKQSQLTGPVFNEFNFGGFLIFSGVATFIDGRADLYGDRFIRRYANTEQLPSLLAEYRITWTILGAKHPDTLLLDRLPGWRRLYSDSVAVVHVRETGSAN